MSNTFVILVCVALAPPAAGEAKLTADAPSIARPVSGDVTGCVTTPAGQGIRTLKAVSRVTGKEYSPSKWDRETGKFLFKKLPGDAAYDICVRTDLGRQVEGIDLDYVDSRLLRMAAQRRKQLRLPPEPIHGFGPRDVTELKEYVADLKDFMEIRRILYIRGHGLRATMLLELIRARHFHARKGDEVIWRIELWYFEYHHGGWERAANVERVLRRQRLPEGQWPKLHVEYYPQLTAKLDVEGKAEPVEFKIPQQSDPSRGRVAGTDVGLKTKPHISGLDVEAAPATKPASRPVPAHRNGGADAAT